MWENIDKNRSDSGHYSIMKLQSYVNGMESLYTMFPEANADDVNFVLFSTSGVHGTSNTIEEAENFLNGENPEGFNGITFLIIHPRLVSLRYGICNPKNKEDIDFLKKLRTSSFEIINQIGYNI